jgi:RNA polymerase sigma-70 factor (ECF subfamily)
MNKRYQEDNLLLDRARTGDEKAYTKLFQIYHDITFHYVMKIIKNQMDAEDITMITLEKAFTNLDKYAPTFGFSSWLLTIAKNTCYDFLIMKKRRPGNFIDVFDTHVQISHSNTPEEQYIHKEIGACLDEAICKLQNNYQDVIRWRYYEDLGFKEIKSKYGVNAYIAQSYLCRAKKQLKKYYASNNTDAFIC